MQTSKKQIPVGSCRQVVAEVQAKKADDGTFKFSIQALGGEVLNHWWMGPIIQDLSGMKMAADRIPLDYIHNSEEVIGYAELQNADGALKLNATIVPFESDRGAEVVHKQSLGVPYQASIDYVPTKPGEILYEQIEEGQVTMVNGKEFQGPLTVVRQWILHGLAICPHGADSDTSVTAQQSQNKNEMMEVSVMDPIKEKKEVQTVESAPVDARAEFKQFVADFGVEKAGKYFEQGLSFDDAGKQYRTDLEAELTAEKQARGDADKKVVELETAKEKQAVPDGHFDEQSEKDEKEKYSCSIAAINKYAKRHKQTFEEVEKMFLK